MVVATGSSSVTRAGRSRLLHGEFAVFDLLDHHLIVAALKIGIARFRDRGIASVGNLPAIEDADDRLVGLSPSELRAAMREFPQKKP